MNLNDRKTLLAASSAALKMAICYPKHNTSYQNLHVLNNRTTLVMLCVYRLALKLYITYNEQASNDEWMNLNLNNYFVSKQMTFMTNKNNSTLVGLNQSLFFILYSGAMLLVRVTGYISYTYQ